LNSVRYLRTAEEVRLSPLLQYQYLPTNIKDVKMLTEIAHQNRIGTDYHLNEPPIALWVTSITSIRMTAFNHAGPVRRGGSASGLDY
jgi:hypothetical protein